MFEHTTNKQIISAAKCNKEEQMGEKMAGKIVSLII